MTKRTAAFFDFDSTLLMTDSGRPGLQYLWEKGEVGLPFLLKILCANFFYKKNLLSEETMARLLLKLYRGKSLDEYRAGADEFYEKYLRPQLAPNILEKVRSHEREGHILVLISGSVRYLLEPVADDCGFDYLICTDLETGPNGLLTGRSLGPVCLDKTKRNLAIKLAGEAGIDLTSSYAYGNHQADIPLLESVGYPSTVEPTGPLRKAAMERGWPILSFK